MRPIVSYDDITSSLGPPELQTGPQMSSPHPAKRRRTNRRPDGRIQQLVQHWDDPGTHAPEMSYSEHAISGDSENAEMQHADDRPEEAQEKEEEEESRELTQEEIWDDSALVDAWNSAMAEYEAFHGGSQWKDEAVKRSPLWYNVPPTIVKRKSKPMADTSTPSIPELDVTGVEDEEDSEAEGDEDSAPLNFDTFVPTHDPSLKSAAAAQDQSAYTLPDAPDHIVSQDEAFSCAMSAMYWARYYTAVYYWHRNQNTGAEDVAERGEDELGREQNHLSFAHMLNDVTNLDLIDFGLVSRS
ncbi:hypothetical protein WOLCODRAFT_134941 [Wolfiporia cocos MD-104 SS10]|uniref:Survival Motor Neuron Gemin2-binding domain-containing protein n=1 Tax=Wolfiporia cocos (strain MD-104) TaxID=742152 RepID=A0A2H3IUM4_WOLCO|nr:hypothetical protein WOLCODRAFT_134941 [Wolfiporia cocos MD-104 SS10]